MEELESQFEELNIYAREKLNKKGIVISEDASTLCIFYETIAQLEAINALGIKNLRAKGVTVNSNATIYEIMQLIADIT